MSTRSRARLATLAAGVLVTLGAGAVEAEAGVIRFQPVADAHVSKAKKKANFGGSKRLVVDGSPVVRSYLRFNVRGLGGAVSYATLQLSVMRSSTGGLLVRRAGANHWGEQSIRFANAPRFRSAPTARSRAVKAFRTASINVTKLIRGNGVVTLVVSSRGKGAASIFSSEGPRILRPQLVVGVNSAPLCVATVLSTTEDTAGTVDPACSDVEREPLSYQVVSKGTLGTASVAGGKLRYVPKADANGSDRFTYRARDKQKWSRPVGVTVIIRPVNDAPECVARSLTVDEDGGEAVGALCTDVERDPLSYSITSSAQQGKSFVVAGDLRYEPFANTNGADTFSYRARDASLPSAPATVSVNVRPVNDAPTCANVGLSTIEDVAGERNPDCSDIDGDALALGIASQARSGSAAIVGGRLHYIPSANFFGGDDFTYFASDGVAASAPAAAGVTIAAVNDAPVCQALPLVTPEDTPREINPNCSDVEGSPLSYAIFSQGAKGTASISGVRLRYEPDLDATGADSFSYQATDGELLSAAAPVSVTIGVLNDAPVCTPRTLTLEEDSSGKTLPACTDTEGDTLTYSIASQGSLGTASVVGNELRYAGHPNAHGTDSFTYRAHDGDKPSAPAQVTVTIGAVNDAPECFARTLTLNEDAPQGIVTPLCTDVENDPLTFEIVDHPLKGTASIVGGSIRYVPNPNANGSDTFTYRADDGPLTSAPAPVSVTIIPINDVPVAQSQSASTAEDSAKALTLGATDVEGGPLTFTIVSGPAHGSLSGTGADRTYTPAANYHGPDSFTFKVNDGAVDSNVATVSLSVTSVNDAPVALEQSASTAEDSAKPLTLAASDVDGNPLTFTIVSGPAHGTLSGTGASRTYTPAANYHGPDSFTFKVNDGTVDSNVAAVTLSVSSVNDVPVAQPQSASTPEDAAKSLTLGASDVDGNPLTFTIVTGPAHGTLSGSGASRTYTPAANYYGPDNFTFKANDGTVDSNVATVALAVDPVNDAPVCANVPLATVEDTMAEQDPACTDIDGGPLTYSIVGLASKGTASVVAGKLRFVPAVNANGADSFTYQANDGAADSTPATVSVTIAAVNDAPVAEGQSASTAEDTAKSLSLGASDVDVGDTLTLSIVSGPAHGALSGSGASRIYTPAANYHGPDSFTFKANDGAANSNVATVSLTVTPVNDPPVAQDQSASTLEDTVKALTLGGSDVDGNPLSFAIVAGPAHGALSGSGASRTYTPATNYHGPDSITFKVNDGTVDSNVATVSLTVSPVNDPPVAEPQSASTPEDTAKALTLGASDVDSGTLSFTVVSGPAHGTLSGSGPDRTYTPAANYNGPDSFTFKVNDGAADSNVATVTLNVGSVNDPPVAEDQTASTAEDTAKPLTLGASDPEGGPLTFIIVSQPAHGTLSSGTGASRTYTPAANYNGPDSFTFKVNDGSVDSNVATVSLTVTAVNDAPVAVNQSPSTPEDAAKTLTLEASDVDSGTLTFSIVSEPAHGTVSSGTGPDRTYMPDPNYNGPDSFTFKASDGTADSNVATVSLTITPANDPPSCANVPLATNEDVIGERAPSCTDIDGDALTYSIVAPATHGTASVVAGKLHYAPNANTNGADSFTYRANDGSTNSGAATVSVTVAAVNDPPVCADVSLDTAEDTPAERDPSCTDIDSGALTYSIVGQGGKGAASVVAGQLHYAPNANANGIDSITYRASDGAANGVPATVSVTIQPANDAPVCNGNAFNVNEDGNLSQTACTDVDGDSLTLTTPTAPSHGAVTPSTDGGFNYVPDQDYNGPDSFTVVAEDPGGLTSGAAATITITVVAVNDAPTCNPVTLTTPVNVPGIKAPDCVDVEGDSLTFEIVTQPAHGTAIVIANELSYTPDLGYGGPDLFTYRAGDGTLFSPPANVTVTVGP